MTSERIIDHGDSVMEASKIKEFQTSLERIGKRESTGFFFIAEITGEQTGSTAPANGAMFSHRTHPTEIVFNLVETIIGLLGPTEKLGLLQGVAQIVGGEAK